MDKVEEKEKGNSVNGVNGRIRWNEVTLVKLLGSQIATIIFLGGFFYATFSDHIEDETKHILLKEKAFIMATMEGGFTFSEEEKVELLNTINQMRYRLQNLEKDVTRLESRVKPK